MISDILWVNHDIQTIYHSSGVLICKSDDEFNKLVLQEKKKIANRDYILNRYEAWEVDNLKSLKMLLIGRCRNANEKNLVLKYMDYMKE